MDCCWAGAVPNLNPNNFDNDSFFQSCWLCLGTGRAFSTERIKGNPFFRRNTLHTPEQSVIRMQYVDIHIHIYMVPPSPKPTFLVTLLVFGVDLWRNFNPISLCLLATPGSGSMNYRIRD